MKILLIQPAALDSALGRDTLSMFEPLALEYLAAGCAGHHDVRILDMRLDARLDTCLRDFRPGLVGITAYTVHVNGVKKLFEEVRAFDRNIITVAGGHHATIMPEDFCIPAVTAVIAGEGVSAFRDLLECLERGGDIGRVAGARAMENGTILIDRQGEEIDLDGLPFPRRDLTSQYRGAYSTDWMKPLASIRTSKGCLFRCKFCALWKLTGGRYLTRKPERIVEELAAVKERYVFFADDESLLDVPRMEALADLIGQSGIKKRFFLYGRSDTIARNFGLLEKWKRVGLERVFVGLEFFRDQDLKLIRKGSRAEDNRKAVQILKDLNLSIFPTFIVRPDFTREDFAELRRYCIDLELDFIGFSVLTPLPGTDLYEEVKGDFITRNYDHFDFFHTILPTRLPLQEFFEELAGLYMRSRPLKSQLRLLLKYRLREIPALLKTYRQFLRRLKTLPKDYESY